MFLSSSLVVSALTLLLTVMTMLTERRENLSGLPAPRPNFLDIGRQSCTNQTDELKTILMWNNLYGSKERVVGKGREPFCKLGCQETRSELKVVLQCDVNSIF